MNIIMAFNTGFFVPAITTIYSLFTNNNGVKLNILYTDLSDNAMILVKKLEGCGSGNTVCFTKLEQEMLERIKVATGRWRPECFFRYYVTELMTDVDRVLWLDSDILVRRSIEELYNTDMEEKSFAGVTDYTSNPVERLGIKDYINSGVLLFNLEKLRHSQMMSRFWEHVASPDYAGDLPDQDALNIVFEGDIKLLDQIYNSMPLTINEYADIFIENAAIVHFVSEHKPWKMEEMDYFAACMAKFRTADVFFREYWKMLEDAAAFVSE
ncbi:MAG: glycosyltransferase family 8 protein [Lachnospiraceae bacterium]|nr:glycosyltransferase family 8 protein [Lachnospiraceae bacterium]